MIAARGGAPLHHIGPPRDLALIAAAAERAGVAPALVGPDEAAYVLCTGLFDDSTETPEDYAGRLASLRRAPVADDLRQSRSRRPSRPQARLLRRRARRGLRGARRRDDLRRQAASADLQSGAGEDRGAARRSGRAGAGAGDRRRACAPTSPAPPRPGSTPCSSPTASIAANSMVPARPTTRCSGCSRRPRRGRSPPSARSSLSDQAPHGANVEWPRRREAGIVAAKPPARRSAPPCRVLGLQTLYFEDLGSACANPCARRSRARTWSASPN